MKSWNCKALGHNWKLKRVCKDPYTDPEDRFKFGTYPLRMQYTMAYKCQMCNTAFIQGGYKTNEAEYENHPDCEKDRESIRIEFIKDSIQNVHKVK